MDFPPLPQKQIDQLRRDASNIRATSARKGLSPPSDLDVHCESAMAQSHFELGCWLNYYRRLITKDIKPGDNEGFLARVDCAKRIFQSGIMNPRYEFFTVFDFGQRDFDAIFEMGDSDCVIDALRDEILYDSTGNLARAFKHFNWPMAPKVKTHLRLDIPGEVCHISFSRAGGDVEATLEAARKIWPDCTIHSQFIRGEMPDDPEVLKDMLATAVDSLAQQGVSRTLDELGRMAGKAWVFSEPAESSVAEPQIQ